MFGADVLTESNRFRLSSFGIELLNTVLGQTLKNSFGNGNANEILNNGSFVSDQFTDHGRVGKVRTGNVDWNQLKIKK